MDELEIILKTETITPEELEEHCFGKVTNMHNGHEVYCNKDYTLVIRDCCGTDYYNIYCHWKNEND
jgi:hypothetical protein